jgi:type IV fimbrial biogenesis protein FimT
MSKVNRKARSKLTPQKCYGGFTFIELILTLLIAAILLVIGVPMMTETIDRNRLTSRVNDLLAGMQLTRSEAIKRNGPVIACGSADSVNCSAGNWATNWVVFVDVDGDGKVTDDTELLYNSNWETEGFTVKPTAGFTTAVIYRSDGSAAGTPGDFAICQGLKRGTKVVISFTGRPRAEKIDSADLASDC